MSNDLEPVLKALEEAAMTLWGYGATISASSADKAIVALKEAIKQQGEPVAVTRTGFRLEWCAPHYGLVNGEAVQHPDGTKLYTSAPTIPAWQPIETAPKDGKHVLLYVGEGATVTTTGGFWDDHPECCCWIAGGYMRKQIPPTHWMPLPNAPKQGATK